MTRKVTKMSDVKREREKAKDRAWKKLSDVEKVDHHLFALVDALKKAPEGSEDEYTSPRFLGDHSFPLSSAWFLSGQVLVRVLYVDRPAYVDTIDLGVLMVDDEEIPFGRAYSAEITAWSLNGRTRYFKRVLDPADVEHSGIYLCEISLNEETQRPLVFDVERTKHLVVGELARRGRKNEEFGALLDRTLYIPDRRKQGGPPPVHLVNVMEVGEPLFVSQIRERSRRQMETMTPEDIARAKKRQAAVRHIMEQVFGPPKKAAAKPRLHVVK